MENNQDRRERPSIQDSEQILLMPVSELAGLWVSGDDAFTFLQGQATCDLRQIEANHSSLGAFCNPQGRVVATFRILLAEQGYLLLLADDLLQPVTRRLQMYVLRAKVTVQPTDFHWLGLAGSVQQLFPEAPGETDAVTRIEGLSWIRVFDPQPRWLVTGDPGGVRKLQQKLESIPNVVKVSDHAWRLRDIRCGIPAICRATAEKFLPQMLNLDLLGAVSFDKGCYTGQEVIARSQFRGQIKRRMYHLGAPLPQTPAPGDPLVDQGDIVGQVINAAPAGAMQEFLAVIRCDRAHSSTIRLKTAPEIPLSWRGLGYTLP